MTSLPAISPVLSTYCQAAYLYIACFTTKDPGTVWIADCQSSIAGRVAVCLRASIYQFHA